MPAVAASFDARRRRFIRCPPSLPPTSLPTASFLQWQASPLSITSKIRLSIYHIKESPLRRFLLRLSPPSSFHHDSQRDRHRERANARTTGKGKGKDDGFTPEQRRERGMQRNFKKRQQRMQHRQQLEVTLGVILFITSLCNIKRPVLYVSFSFSVFFLHESVSAKLQ
ncbi:PREDICTED: uncharacterized protein LOC105973566 [Erythranthe guttata]|uniref:uncharacterized protein LOC105973566 n=1 Tax=Erythranthe guttata TaxID=4155 RepID=UPI00064DE7EE|nr:PREDICTED: uncharacterized protein LOC105973566 [Erythranthe guttata]|eukprot:XP_012854056.1 PREDICTED: uncharacterized protein LOC105973566 [Erythranthe guttata]